MGKIYQSPDFRRYKYGNCQYSECANVGKSSWQICDSYFYYKADSSDDCKQKECKNESLNEKGVK